MKAYMKGYESKFNFFYRLLTEYTENSLEILEIGAHFGEDTQRFLDIFDKKIEKIYCFEPDPRSIEIFKKHVNDDRAILYQLALSDKECELPFYQSYNPNETTVPKKYEWIKPEDYVDLKLAGTGASSLKKGYHLASKDPIYVKSVRYDDWAEKNKIDSIDLAWIDVQGAEKDVIEGMGRRINDISFVWIEYGEMFYEGSMNRGETVKLMSTKNFIEMPGASSKQKQGDILFVNKKLVMT